MKKIRLLLVLLALLLLWGCSGDDDKDKDKTPPTTPVMIPHLGDTGDPRIMINDAWVEISDDNNGIDTVPEGQWIRLAWEPFIDNDLSHLKIYRFSDLEPDAGEIAEIPANSISYLDKGPLVERSWYSYYIELFDASGNSSVSDTVSYAILTKPNLISPANGASVSTSGLYLEWDAADDGSGFYRVLVWDEELELLWYYDVNVEIVDEEDDMQIIKCPFPVMSPVIASGSTLRWRVDYFDWDEEHQMYMGSESNERIFHVR